MAKWPHLMVTVAFASRPKKSNPGTFWVDAWALAPAYRMTEGSAVVVEQWRSVQLRVHLCGNLD
jgi:hypothetical protein